MQSTVTALLLPKANLFKIKCSVFLEGIAFCLKKSLNMNLFFSFFFLLTHILRAQYSSFDSKTHRAFRNSSIKDLVLPVIKLENSFTIYAYMLATLECFHAVLKAYVGVCIYMHICTQTYAYINIHIFSLFCVCGRSWYYFILWIRFSILRSLLSPLM